MSVKAKFQVNSVRKSVNRDGSFGLTEVEMMAVTGKDGTENASWSKYTPSGSLKMSITQEGACDAFTPGQEYFLNFTLAEEKG